MCKVVVSFTDLEMHSAVDEAYYWILGCRYDETRRLRHSRIEIQAGD